jgi:hypothetical protein
MTTGAAMIWRPLAFFIAHAHASMKGVVARPTTAAGSGERSALAQKSKT